MRLDLAIDEALIQRLPLPLAQLYRRAHNAKTPLERHLTAFYLWEAGLKLLASVAVVHYAEHGTRDPELTERLHNLARPSLGHWWEFARRLVPMLAERGEAPFGPVRDLLLGKARDDLPRAAGLDAALREALEGKAGARTTVRVSELFDRLVQYRNAEVGHGAAGQRRADFYDRMGLALLAGVAEVLARLDVLAGRRLVHVPDVRRLASGHWLVERDDLSGEAAKRLEALEVPEGDAACLPRPGRLYWHDPSLAGGASWRVLHPLLWYDAEATRVYFLNARRGQLKVEYLCYTTGELVKRDELGDDRRELFARILGGAVEGAAVAAWAERSRDEEPPAPAAEARPAQRTIGEFELLSRIGRGGMGVVYRAWQPSLDRQVALKCLLRAGDLKAEARFAREIRALGRVEHPHLAKVFTSGAEADQWFYAMELIEGADLSAVCTQLTGNTTVEMSADAWVAAVSTACDRQRQQEAPLSADDGPAAEPRRKAAAPEPTANERAGRGHVAHVVEIVRQVAEAAHALHEAGVIHRDIKPGNIMVNADGSRAVLMDLGLAQLADEIDGKLTRTRQFVGTLRYASPEQVLAVDKLDRRSDVYSLGVTLWELLALRPMYGATEQTPTPELMKRIQYGEPERLRRYHRAIPADLEAIVMKCLEKDPARRYATAHDLADDLTSWQHGKPVQARPLTWSYVTRKYLRRHRKWIVLVLGLVLMQLALALAINALYRSVSGTHDGPLSEAPEEQGERPVLAIPLGGRKFLYFLDPEGKPRVLRSAISEDEAVIQIQADPASSTRVLAIGLSPGRSRVTLTDDDGNRQVTDVIVAQPGRPSSQLEEDLSSLAKDTAQLLQKEHEDSIAIGPIQGSGPPELVGSAGPGIGKALADELMRLGINVQKDARLKIQGSYALVSGDKPTPLAARLNLVVVDSAEKVVGSLTADVKFTPSPKVIRHLGELDGARALSSLLAVTAVLPPDENLKSRQQKFRERLEHPRVHIAGTVIFADAASPYGIEILVDDQPRKPTSNEKGLAFVAIQRGERYAVRVINNSDYDAAVTLTIDGLSMFAFSKNRQFTQVIVPAKQSGVIKGWHRTNQVSDVFEVTAYSKSEVARVLPGSSAIGTITVTFAAAWSKSTREPADELAAKLARSRGEDLATGRGPELKTQYKEVERHIGVVRAAISVRYTRSE
jgi:serine/threonine protein kinase